MQSEKKGDAHLVLKPWPCPTCQTVVNWYEEGKEARECQMCQKLLNAKRSTRIVRSQRCENIAQYRLLSIDPLLGGSLNE